MLSYGTYDFAFFAYAKNKVAIAEKWYCDTDNQNTREMTATLDNDKSNAFLEFLD